MLTVTPICKFTHECMQNACTCPLNHVNAQFFVEKMKSIRLKIVTANSVPKKVGLENAAGVEAESIAVRELFAPDVESVESIGAVRSVL